ncbi:MAG: hypothetical protein OEU32_07380 [Acidimicrobiia bacterium]|nr:hypothetical protein [Acidimicrobiia bacterium]
MMTPRHSPSALGGIITDWTSIDTFARQLDLCALGPDEHAVVLSEAASDPELVETALLATARLGAMAIGVTLADHASAARSALAIAPVVAALRAADLVIDLSTAGLDDDPAAGELLGDHTRVLAAGGLTLYQLRRLVPHQGLGRRVQRALARVSTASVLRLSCEAGTDLSIDLDEAERSGTSGVAATSGDMARWPGGLVTIAPAASTVSGTLVLMPRDLYLALGEYVRSPVTITIENDHVADVSGNAGDADLLRSMLGAAGTTAGYGFASIAFGMNQMIGASPHDRAGGTRMHHRDASLAAGVVTVTFGANSIAGRPGAERVGLALRRRTVEIDDQPIITDGSLQGDLRPDVYELAAATSHQSSD